MNDVIYRQAALDALGDEPEVWTGKDEYAQGLNNQWHYDRNAIKALPTVDAVPVVRCKNCKSFSHGYCRFHDAKFVRPDGYCYWGERKDGEHHES